MHYYLGLPMWSNRDWLGNFFSADAGPSDFLPQYASVFNSVEGNTTFYGIPDAKRIANWRAQVPAGFRFSFKFPRTISHERGLRGCKDITEDFFRAIAPLQKNLGPLMLQLPASFAPEQLPDLKKFLTDLPAAFAYSVEVRHEAFFNNSDDRQRLNELLGHLHIDRVCFDSRALFAATASDAATCDAKRKKPNLAVQPVALGQHPVVRFIGQLDLNATMNFFALWQSTLKNWLAEGKEPYFFIHTPDNKRTYQLALQFHQLLQSEIAGLPDLNSWPVQRYEQTGQMGLF